MNVSLGTHQSTMFLSELTNETNGGMWRGSLIKDRGGRKAKAMLVQLHKFIADQLPYRR